MAFNGCGLTASSGVSYGDKSVIYVDCDDRGCANFLVVMVYGKATRVGYPVYFGDARGPVELNG